MVLRVENSSGGSLEPDEESRTFAQRSGRDLPAWVIVSPSVSSVVCHLREKKDVAHL